jgi:hypothetical protein
MKNPKPWKSSLDRPRIAEIHNLNLDIKILKFTIDNEQILIKIFSYAVAPT